MEDSALYKDKFRGSPRQTEASQKEHCYPALPEVLVTQQPPQRGLARAITEDLEPLSPEEGVEWFLKRRKSVLVEGTLQKDQTWLNTLLNWCEEYQLENLNLRSGHGLDPFVRWQQDQVVPITLQKQMSTYRQVLRFWTNNKTIIFWDYPRYEAVMLNGE